jgi:hypothetical protein
VSGGDLDFAESYGAAISGGNGITVNSATNYAWDGGVYHTP